MLQTIDRPRLSAREIEVAELMTDGLSNKLIGVELGISEHTVNFHVSNVCRKLGKATRAGAAAMAVRLGIVQ